MLRRAGAGRPDPAGGPEPVGSPTPAAGAVIAVAMEPRLVGQFFDEQARARLGRLGTVVPVGSWQDLTAGDAPGVLQRTHVLVTGWGTGPITPAVLDSAPRLGAVVHSAGSVRFLLSEECYRRGVVVSSQADLNAQPVAEYALAMILLAGKGVFEAQQRYRTRRGAVDQVGELAHVGNHRRRVGIVGASKIGRRVIDLLRPFDLEVAVYDPYLAEQQAASLGVRLVSLTELLTTSTVVSLHAPMNEATRHMIGARELALLPDGATLVNTARGGLVDQDALVAELRRGRLRAVIDTTDPEVSPPESELWDLPNLVLTPHVAGAWGNELHRLGDGVVADVEQFVRCGVMSRAITAEAFAMLA